MSNNSDKPERPNSSVLPGPIKDMFKKVRMSGVAYVDGGDVERRVADMLETLRGNDLGSPGQVVTADHYGKGRRVSVEQSADVEQANKEALDGRVVDENRYGSAANQDGIPPCQERKGSSHS